MKVMLVCPGEDERTKGFSVSLNAEDAAEIIPSLCFVDPVKAKGQVVRDAGAFWLLLDATARVRLECGRCLEAFDREVSAHVEQKYVPEEMMSETKQDDEEVLPATDERIDVSGPLREAILLAIPGYPLCEESCPGLCRSCGRKLSAADCACGATPRGFGLTLGEFIIKRESQR